MKSVDASSLVITTSGKKGGDMSFKLDSTTQKEGSIASGSPVSIRYRMDGSSMVATAVNAEAPKAQKTREEVGGPIERPTPKFQLPTSRTSIP